MKSRKNIFISRLSLFAGIALSMTFGANAAVYTWDADGLGSLNNGDGSWNATDGTNWWNGITYGPWGNTTSAEAIFGVNTAGSGAAGAITVGTVTANKITFNAAESGNYTLSGGTITLGGSTPTLAANVDATINSVLAGTAGFTKSGAGVLTLGGANTIQGAVKITDGTVVVSSTGRLQSSTWDTNSTINVSEGGVLSMSAWGYNTTGSFGQVQQSVTLNVLNNGTFKYTGGTVTPGANVFGFTIQSGGGTLLAEGTVGSTWTTGWTTSNNSTYNRITLSGTLTLSGSQNGAVGHYLDGSGGVIKDGSGTWTIGANTAADDTYSGGTTVKNGTLKLGRATALGNTSGILTLNGGTLDLNGYAPTVGTLSGTNGSITDNSSGAGTTTLTVGQAVNGVFGGTIGNGTTRAVALTKTGTGSLTLGGTNTYTGATIVSTGSLKVTGSLASGSAVAVDGSSISYYGMLGGSGTVNGAVSVNQFAHLSPSLATGTAATTLNVSGNLTFAAGSAIDTVFTLNGAANDLVHGAGTNTLTLPGSGVVAVNLFNGAGGLGNGTYTLFDNFSSLAGGSPATALGVGTSPLSGKTYTFAGITGGVTLTIADQSDYVWNGTAGDNNLQTGGNWNGGSAPTAGSGLHFAGSTRTSPNNDFTAGTSFGNLTFDSGAAGFTLGGNAIGLTGDVVNSSSNLQTVNPAIAFSGIRVVDTGAAGVTLGGDITGIGTLTKTGAGSLSLNGNNTAYAGNLTVASGTVKAGGANALPATALTLSATLDVNGYNLTTGSLTGNGTITSSVAGTPVFTVGDGTSTTFTGVIQNGSATALGLTKQGTGMLTLSGANSYTGATTINGGTLAVTGGAAIPNSGDVSLANAAGATLLLNAGETIGSLAGGGATGGNVNLQGNTLTVGGSAVTSYSGVITGTGSLVKTGAGTLALGGLNTFSGNVNVREGVLEVTASGKLNAAGTFNGSAVVTVGGGVSNSATLKLISWGYNTAGGFGQLDLAYSLMLLDNGVVEFTGPAGGGQRAFQVGANGGTLLSNGSGLWTIGEGGNASYNQIPTSGALTLGGSQNGDLKSYVTGSGSVVKTGAGTWTFGSNSTGENNTYSGDTTIQNGTLKLRSGFTANAIPSGTGKGNVIITSPGILDLNSRSATVNGLSGAGTVTSSAAGALDLTIGANDQTSIFGGVIEDGAGTVSLTKTGTGSLTLSGSNSYTGTTTANSGTLVINGDQSAATGAVSVNNAGTRLKGTGTIGGNTTVNSGAIHSAGNGVGKQTFDQPAAATTSLSYSPGSIFEWELSATPAETVVSDLSNYASNRGVAYDAANVTGTLGGSGATFRILLNGSQTFADSFWNQNRTWTDIFRNGDGTGTGNLDFASIFGGFEYFNATTGNIGNTNTTGRGFTITGSTLSWTAVPEVSNMLAGGLLGLGLLRRRRV